MDQVNTLTADSTSIGTTVALKLEAVTIPVSDLDRAKEFYTRLGWRLDADFSHGDERVLQFTPPGSPASVQFGTGGTSAPGSVQNSYLVVSDIQEARDQLVALGADVSEIFHYAAGPAPFGGQVRGLAPNRATYGSYATFKDPDGNSWLLQEVTTRFPGRVDSKETSYGSTYDLASAMRRASVAHGEHETRTGGGRHENWPDWYAEYMAAEQAGRPLPA
jgi:catechol 2,3-dioxygenase-like lactoylglutathione lyase family enzyme